MIKAQSASWYAGPSVAAQGVLKTAAKLALKGATVNGGEVFVDNRVYCDSPVRVGRRTDPRDGGVRTLEVSMNAPCRKCPKCIQFRQMRWRERIINELVMTDDEGRRTWFVTLTFSPVHLAGIIAEAGSSSAGSVEKAAYAHVQKYFKRLRKWGAQFRYFGVAEYGETKGRLHFHLLLHEQGTHPLPKAVLQGQWRSHVHAKLVDCSGDRGIGGAASYVSTYATKTEDCRPRASVRYGTPRAKSSR